MSITLRSWSGLLCSAALAAGMVAGAVTPAQALTACAAPVMPESRSSAFDARLFQRGGADLSISGQAQLSAFAQALTPVALEVVVIAVPAPSVMDTETPQDLAQQRAETVRRQLMNRGVPRERIYIEQRKTELPARVAMDAPLVIETIAAWPRQVAMGRGWRCIA